MWIQQVEHQYSFLKVFRILMLIVNCYSEFTPADTDMNAIVDGPF